MPNEELLILRGKYITLIELQKKITSEIKSFKRTILSLEMIFDSEKLTSTHCQQVVYESSFAIQRIKELHMELCNNQAEIDRLYPLTGL